MTCSVEGCDKLAKTRGWCPAHYERWRRNGTLELKGRKPRPKNTGPCAMPGCGRVIRARGLCATHHRRWWLSGDPRADQPVRPIGRPLIERLLAKVEINEPTGCWRWTGAQTKGYGRIGLPGQKAGDVHRVAYEYWVGPIPDGMHIDHVWARGCRFTDCCNPDHLEAVTQVENNRRARVFAHLKGV